MRTSKFKLPKLYYSTWGEGFYSKVWVNKDNNWMYALLKFAEANLDFEKDQKHLHLFEKMAASDYPFMHRNGEQRKYAEETFLSYFYELMENIPLRKDKIITAYPVDPYWGYFALIEKSDKAKSETENEVQLTIHKIGFDKNAGTENKRFNTIGTEKIQFGDYIIYYQNFILYPDHYYQLSEASSGEKLLFKMPERGIPFMIVTDLEIAYTYESKKLNDKLAQIWGKSDIVPNNLISAKGSKCIYTLEHLKKILPPEPKTAVFKYNKECYSLIRYKDLSSLNPSVIFDDRITVNDSGEYINLPKTGIPVTSELDKMLETDFNLLLFTCSINFESELEIVRALVKKALERNIPIISLYDDIMKYEHLQDILKDQNLDNVYYVGVPQSEIKDIDTETYLNYKPQKVLGIFGTDTVQGKFTTQIALREELKKHLNVTHFATEPTGILAGADVSFSRMDEADEKKRLAAHRKMMSDLENVSDVLITGGQNSIVKDTDGTGNYSKNVSTRIYDIFIPEWVILTVNVDTPIEIINNALSYIDELNLKYNKNTKVIAFAIMTGRKIHGERWTETYFIDVNKDEIQNAKAKIKSATNLDVFSTPEEIKDLAVLVKNIVEEKESLAITI
ncbi:MAG: DUF1611 domain-containing protein [Rhodothermaceae bacterium]